MEVKIETHIVGGKIVAEGGITVVSSDRDFCCSLEGLASEKIKGIEISPFFSRSLFIASNESGN